MTFEVAVALHLGNIFSSPKKEMKSWELSRYICHGF